MALKISQTVRKGETRVEGGREGLLHVPGFPFPFWEFFTLGLAAVARGGTKNVKVDASRICWTREELLFF